MRKTPPGKRNLFSILRIINEYLSALGEIVMVKEYDVEDNVKTGWAVSWSEVAEAYSIKENQIKRSLI